MNEEHLRGETAPDNILFSVDPIECRLPSLDDGPSWPALFDNYTVAKTDTDYGLLYLRRNVVHPERKQVPPPSRMARIRQRNLCRSQR